MPELKDTIKVIEKHLAEWKTLPKSYAQEQGEPDHTIIALSRTLSILTQLQQVEGSGILPREKEIPTSFGIPDKISKDMGFNEARHETALRIVKFSEKLPKIIQEFVPHNASYCIKDLSQAIIAEMNK